MPSALYKNRQEWSDFFVSNMQQEALDEFKQKGFEEGRQEVREEMALKFSTKTEWPAQEIADFLNISLQKVEQIIAAHAAK